MREKLLHIRNVLQTNFFYKLLIVYICIGLPVALLIPKSHISLYINQYANEHKDVFFITYTDLGLGGVIGICAAVFLFIRFYYTVWSIITLMITGIFVYIFKQVLFYGLLRPAAYIGFDKLHHVIDGFSYDIINTFPSGHSMTAFALAAILVTLSNKKLLAILMFIYAISITYSRIYLMEHFFVDTFCGGLLGVLAAILGLSLTNYICKNKNWHNYSLLTVFSKQKRDKITAQYNENQL